MLGLRPRPFLRPRPSLLDLIQHKDIDQRSRESARPQPLEVEIVGSEELIEEQEEAESIALPLSPEKSRSPVAIRKSLQWEEQLLKEKAEASSHTGNMATQEADESGGSYSA